MTLQSFVTDYGYLAVFAGCFLEGETILVLAGVAAHEGLLSLPWVVTLAAIAGTMGDQVYFYVGRRYGLRLFARFPSLRQRAVRFETLLHRHHAPIIVFVRFMYGLRIVGPIVIGMCRISPWRFALFNSTGAILWAVIVAGLGYLFGEAVQYVLHAVGRYQAVALGGVAAVAVLVWVTLHLAGRRVGQEKRRLLSFRADRTDNRDRGGR